MFGIGGDARRFGLLSIARPPPLALLVSADSAEAEGALPGAAVVAPVVEDAAVVAAVVPEPRPALVRLGLLFPAWRSLTHC